MKSALLFGGAIAVISFAWRADGGLGLETNTTTFIFLAAILAVVVYLTIRERDRSPASVVELEPHA